MVEIGDKDGRKWLYPASIEDLLLFGMGHSDWTMATKIVILYQSDWEMFRH